MKYGPFSRYVSVCDSAVSCLLPNRMTCNLLRARRTHHSRSPTDSIKIMVRLHCERAAETPTAVIDVLSPTSWTITGTTWSWHRTWLVHGSLPCFEVSVLMFTCNCFIARKENVWKAVTQNNRRIGKKSNEQVRNLYSITTHERNKKCLQNFCRKTRREKIGETYA
jgi:hypothetical protein